jgi:hypothetical protein
LRLFVSNSRAFSSPNFHIVLSVALSVCNTVVLGGLLSIAVQLVPGRWPTELLF